MHTDFNMHTWIFPALYHKSLSLSLPPLIFLYLLFTDGVYTFLYSTFKELILISKCVIYSRDQQQQIVSDTIAHCQKCAYRQKSYRFFFLYCIDSRIHFHVSFLFCKIFFFSLFFGWSEWLATPRITKNEIEFDW